MSDTTPPPQVWPTLRANDARGLIRFLVDVVGFEETAVYGEGDVVHHAELSWPPGGGVMLGSARPDDGHAVDRIGRDAGGLRERPGRRHERIHGLRRRRVQDASVVRR